MDWGVLLDAAAFLVRELALFAAAGFLVLGASDLLVDLIWLGIQGRRRLIGIPRTSLVDLPPPAAPGRIAVFVPAWQEANVIGPMLRHALGTWADADFTLYVGCYPNDPATIAAVEAIHDGRIRLVVGSVPGPTTKAGNLNAIWQAMRADEAAGARPFKAVVLHDAEDVVHSAELALFDRMIERFDLVQLPVLPLPHPGSVCTAGSYIDEFAEALREISEHRFRFTA